MYRPWQYIGLALLTLVGLGLAAYALERDPTPKSPSAFETPAASPTSDESVADGKCVAPKRLAVLGDSTRREASSDGAFFGTLRERMPDTKVKSFARDRDSLDGYVTDPVQREIDTWAPDAVEFSLGIEDLRLDPSKQRITQFEAELGSFVDGLQVRFGEIPIVASLPAALSTHDVDGSGYVKPPEAAAIVTSGLRAAYLDVAADRPWLTVVDAQEAVTGTKADTAEPPTYLSDQIHPNAETAATIAGLVADKVGCPG